MDRYSNNSVFSKYEYHKEKEHKPKERYDYESNRYDFKSESLGEASSSKIKEQLFKQTKNSYYLNKVNHKIQQVAKSKIEKETSKGLKAIMNRFLRIFIPSLLVISLFLMGSFAFLLYSSIISTTTVSIGAFGEFETQEELEEENCGNLPQLGENDE